MKHVTEKISAYLNHELPPEERQLVAEHLLNCQTCRTEHNEIKLGSALAAQLKQADAPADLWKKIETSLDEKRKSKSARVERTAFFDSRAWATAAVILFLVGLAAFAYFSLLKEKSPEIARVEPAITANVNLQNSPTPHEVTNRNSNVQLLPNQNSNVPTQKQISTPFSPSPEIAPEQSAKKPRETVKTPKDLPAQKLPSWNVETIAGAPKAGNATILQNGKLAVGETLETDVNSRARVEVADIGEVEIAPNSRVRLVKTKATEHRLALERGQLQAKILAPPRLFIVDTPSAVAVDLGCEYTLDVDEEGNSRLHVTSGFVALERDGRESIVPAGAICFTKHGKGLGTPFSENAAPEFQVALEKFDFANGGAEALAEIIRTADYYDMISLWHLLARAPAEERSKVFDALSSKVKPPKNVTREGVLNLDKKMLDLWWTEIENLWFE